MADRNLNLALRVTADTKEGRAALAQLQQAMKQTGVAGNTSLDPFTASVARASGGAKDLRTQLGPLGAAFGAITAAVSIGQLISLAETYGQMTARVRLATQYTGDFAEVMTALKQTARDTGAPLAETANMYTRLAPALNGLGLTGAAAVNVLKTVNQAVAISGADAQTSAASLNQFAQGMASGSFAGDELKSVLEGVPPLAAAIAEGLGVPVARLKEMGAAGELSAERVIKALSKVAPRVQKDFDKLPRTLGQALTILQNQFVEIVGSADQGAGALSALARAIVFVSDGIGAFADAGETIAPVVDFVVNAADGVSRFFRLIATGLAGYTLAIQQALSGDLDGAVKTYQAIADEVQRILSEPLAEQTRTDAQAKTSADARLKVEQDLAKEIQKLENLRKVAAGEANADILLDDQQTQKKRIEEAQKATTEQLKGTEALREALRTAWNGAIEGARKAREEAAALFEQAADVRLSGKDKAAERRNRGLSEEERSAIATRDAGAARNAASSAAARAVIKAYEGDLKGAEKLAAEAAKQAERAERFASLITDDDTAANLFEELANIRAQAIEAQGRIKQQEAKAGEDQARAIQEQILAAETRIKALKAELAKPVTIQLDITAAEAKIKTLQDQLATLNGKAGGAGQATQADVRRVDNAIPSGSTTPAPAADKTATIQADTTQAQPALDAVRTAVEDIPDRKTVVIDAIVKDWTSPTSDAASAWNSAQNGYATGGPIRGPGTATSDSILARLSDGEYVIRAAAVRRYGLGFLHALNGMALPRFATGGLVSGAMQPALAESGGRDPLVGSPLVMPDGRQFPVMTTQDVHAQIDSYFRMAALKRGGRR